MSEEFIKEVWVATETQACPNCGGHEFFRTSLDYYNNSGIYIENDGTSNWDYSNHGEVGEEFDCLYFECENEECKKTYITDDDGKLVEGYKDFNKIEGDRNKLLKALKKAAELIGEMELEADGESCCSSEKEYLGIIAEVEGT